MEVVLKKLKITASILKQSLIANIEDMEKAEVLGWCLHNYEKVILLYRKDKHVLRKYKLYELLKKEEKYGEYDIPKQYNTIVTFGSNYTDRVYSSAKEEERDVLIATLSRVKSEALEKGQVYI